MAQSDTTEKTASQADEAAPEALAAHVEAALLCVDKALSASRLAQALNLDEDGAGAVDEAVERLNEAYEQSGRAFRIERVAGGYRVMTQPEHAEVIAALRGSSSDGRLTRAAVETLAIVAYRQPVTRAEVEAIRGVSSGETLRSLMEKRLVDIAGRAEEPGRPILYGTTRHFLESFGLASLRDLPKPEEIAADDA
jgi:segregation and condensation protein B